MKLENYSKEELESELKRREKPKTGHVIVTRYLHGNNEGMEDLWNNDDPQQERARYWLYEIDLQLDVDLKTGEAKIISVSGSPLEWPVPA